MGLKNVFNIETILFQTLNGDTDLKNEISGGIYLGEKSRPLNSKAEDIIINTIALSQESFPQTGYTNVNIYCQDILTNGNQRQPDRIKLKTISEMVLEILRSKIVTGLRFTVENQAVLADDTTNQHFVNLRLYWNIQD